MKVDLSKYANRNVNKVQRLLWEIVWRLLASTNPRWMLQGWRRFILKIFGATLGRNVQIHGGASIWFPRMLEIGDCSWVGKGVNLYCVAPIKIGANAVISEGAFVCTAGHDITSDRFDLKTASVTIGDMAWICARAIILPGCKIGEGAVIAAGSVVTHDVEPWTVVAGNPARFVKERLIDGGESSGTHARKIRVLHVIPGLRPNDGGPATSVPQTAKAQRLAGMDVGIAFFKADKLTDAAYDAEASGVKMHPFAGSHERWNRVKFSLDFLFRFRNAAKNYDIIVIHLNWIFPVWWAAHAAIKLNRPYVMMPRGCISPNAMMNGTWKKWFAGFLDRHAIRHSASMWATSQMEAHWINWYAKNAKVDIVPMGLDTGKYSASGQKPKGNKILLFMSRVSAIKGLDMLAEAWGEAWRPGWKLVIAGPDDRGHTIKMKRLYARVCRMGSYAFHDAVYGEAKVHMLREATAFVLPSRSENWSVSISEAMASGLPVICTKGAPWTCIPKIGAGWRTDISVDGLKAALEEMMGKSEAELHEMGLRGMKWVRDNLDWKSVGTTMRTKIEMLLR